MSVSGPIDSRDLGIVLPHEHLQADLRFLCQAQIRSVAEQKLEHVDREELRQRPMDYLENLDMRDELEAIREASFFRQAGGNTFVDLTTEDLGRDPQTLVRIGDATGLAVLMATGFYVKASHPQRLSTMSVEDIAVHFVNEITVGVDGIRAGVIGEIGTGDPLADDEAKVVRAAARAHLMTGCPINLHMASGCHEVFRVLDLIRDEGVASLSQVVVSHMDVVLNLDQHRGVLESGANVEYDTFGHEGYPDSTGKLMPRDEDRVEALAQLISWGFGSRILVSQDVCMRSLRKSQGGHGYDNLLTRVRPMMNAAGIGEAYQTELLETNPARVFAFLP